MEFEERENEPFIFFAADKTDPGAYNLPLYLSFADPMHCSGLILSPKMSKGFKYVILDVEHTEKDRSIELNAPEDLYDIAALLRDNERFVVSKIYSRESGEQAVAASTTRLHNIAGTYTGKDDPVMLVRVQAVSYTHLGIADLNSGRSPFRVAVHGEHRAAPLGVWISGQLKDPGGHGGMFRRRFPVKDDELAFAGVDREFGRPGHLRNTAGVNSGGVDAAAGQEAPPRSDHLAEGAVFLLQSGNLGIQIKFGPVGDGIFGIGDGQLVRACLLYTSRCV